MTIYPDTQTGRIPMMAWGQCWSWKAAGVSHETKHKKGIRKAISQGREPCASNKNGEQSDTKLSIFSSNTTCFVFVFEILSPVSNVQSSEQSWETSWEKSLGGISNVKKSENVSENYTLSGWSHYGTLGYVVELKEYRGLDSTHCFS